MSEIIIATVGGLWSSKELFGLQQITWEIIIGGAAMSKYKSNLKEIRTASGLTLDQVAEVTGVSKRIFMKKQIV